MRKKDIFYVLVNLILVIYINMYFYKMALESILIQFHKFQNRDYPLIVIEIKYIIEKYQKSIF